MTKLATDVYFTLNNGIMIPALGLGTASEKHELPKTKQAVIAAIKQGIRHIDTAWWYDAEKYIGEALKELFAEGVVEREDLFITTKVWPSYHKNPEKSLDESLNALGVEYVDLFLQHWPIVLKGDENGLPGVPKDDNGNLLFDDEGSFIETYLALEKIQKKGKKVKAIGVSNYTIPLLEELLDRADIVPAVNQIEYHPYLPQQDLVSFCEKHKILIEAYSPYGRGGVVLIQHPVVQKLAKKYSVSENEILSSYHIKSNRIVIPRTTNPGRISSMVELADLSSEDLQTLYEIGEKDPKRFINDPWGYGLGFKYWEGDKSSPQK